MAAVTRYLKTLLGLLALLILLNIGFKLLVDPSNAWQLVKIDGVNAINSRAYTYELIAKPADPGALLTPDWRVGTYGPRRPSIPDYQKLTALAHSSTALAQAVSARRLKHLHNRHYENIAGVVHEIHCHCSGVTSIALPAGAGRLGDRYQ